MSTEKAQGQARHAGCWAALRLLVVPLLVTLAGCGPGGPIRARLDARVQRPKAGVVLFICDGVGERHLERWCAEGTLPNIQKRFVDGGTHVAHSCTCLPPITYGAVATLLTGVGPAQHTIVGNRWFDPDRAFFRNYTTVEDYRDINMDCPTPTIYTLVRPEPSVSVQCAHTRGVTYNIANWAASGVMWACGAFTAVDKLTATSIDEVALWANLHGRWPTVLTLYFPGADTVGHRNGTDSAAYRQAVEHLDYQVGRVCDWLETEGLLDTTYLVLVSDHGLVDVKPEGVFDLVRRIRDDWGRNATARTLQEGPEAWRRAYFDGYDTIVANQNGRGAFLYFAGRGGWDTVPTHAEVERILEAPPADLQLWNIPGVHAVAYLATKDEAIVRSARGRARVQRRVTPEGTEFAYRPESADVLGYTQDAALAAFVAAGYHDSRAWLAATAAQEVPDFVPHIVPLLHVHRAGQVLVFSKPGYSFTPERAGHGGIHRDELHAVCLFAGPGIPRGRTLPAARAVDVAPTLLDLLGIEYDAGQFDGVSMKPVLVTQEAQQAAHQDDR